MNRKLSHNCKELIGYTLCKIEINASEVHIKFNFLLNNQLLSANQQEGSLSKKKFLFVLIYHDFYFLIFKLIFLNFE